MKTIILISFIDMPQSDIIIVMNIIIKQKSVYTLNIPGLLVFFKYKQNNDMRSCKLERYFLRICGGLQHPY